MGAHNNANTIRKGVSLALAFGLLASMMTACSMGKTATDEDAIELAAGPESEAAVTDAAPAESAELAAAPEAAPAAPDAAPEAAPVAEAAPPAETPAPAPVAAAVPAPSDSAEGGTYTVRSGDTLMKIAFESYGDLFAWRKIFEANQPALTDPNVIPVGTALVIPHLEGRAPASVPSGSEKYKIQSGETLGSISGKVYGDKSLWKRLWEQNKSWIKDPNKIFAGFFLYYTLSDEDKARVPASN